MNETPMTEERLLKIRRMIGRSSETLNPFTLREYIVACETLLSAYDALVAERERLTAANEQLNHENNAMVEDLARLSTAERERDSARVALKEATRQLDLHAVVMPFAPDDPGSEFYTCGICLAQGDTRSTVPHESHCALSALKPEALIQ